MGYDHIICLLFAGVLLCCERVRIAAAAMAANVDERHGRALLTHASHMREVLRRERKMQAMQQQQQQQQTEEQGIQEHQQQQEALQQLKQQQEAEWDSGQSLQDQSRGSDGLGFREQGGRLDTIDELGSTVEGGVTSGGLCMHAAHAASASIGVKTRQLG